jgi:hypothetical protein
MRPERRRTKKLIVAFQFQFANQAAWNCDECRKRGMVKTRHCAFANEAAAQKPIWARRGVTTTQCPKSLITAESLVLIEEFQVWKRFGCADVNLMSARKVEALSILENEWQKEIESMNKVEGA